MGGEALWEPFPSWRKSCYSELVDGLGGKKRYNDKSSSLDQPHGARTPYLGPKTRSIARPSAASPSGVDVAWALTYPTDSAESPDSSGRNTTTEPHDNRKRRKEVKALVALVAQRYSRKAGNDRRSCV